MTFNVRAVAASAVLALAALSIPSSAIAGPRFVALQDSVKSAAHSTADAAEDATHATVKATKKAGHAVADKSEDAKDATVKGAKKTGHVVADNAEDTGNWVGRTARKVGRGIKHMFGG